MKILDLIQGTDEWLTARLEHLCASEAPAMMGDSKFMSRNQLLALKKGQAQKPIDSFTQKLFDKGHAAEDAAREILEMDMCGDMPGVVGSEIVNGLPLLSSFDGYGEAGQTACLWEHKLWNETLAENVRNKVLEPHYYWQLEHQMLTADVGSMLFMVSDGTTNNRESMTYESVPERRGELISGWKQFVVDLGDYQIEAKTEQVVAKQQAAFPAIECKVEGSVVVSNLGEYIPLIQALANEQMSVILDSDQDFADKAVFNTNVKKGRESLKLKACEIETAFESLAEFNGFVKQADTILQKLQSHGEKQVKESKNAKKLKITNGAQTTINDYLSELSKTIDGIQIYSMVTADWTSIIKGKRSFKNMQDAVDAETANLKIQGNEITATIRKNLDSLKELAGEHKFLFADHLELIMKDNDDLVNLIKMRITEHATAEAVRLQKIQDDADAKAKTKAAADAEALAEEAREKIRTEEREKLEAKAQPKAEALAPVQTQPAPQQLAPVVKDHVHTTARVVAQHSPPATLLDDLATWANKHGVGFDASTELQQILTNYSINLNVGPRSKFGSS